MKVRRRPNESAFDGSYLLREQNPSLDRALIEQCCFSSSNPIARSPGRSLSKLKIMGLGEALTPRLSEHLASTLPLPDKARPHKPAARGGVKGVIADIIPK